MRFYLVAAVASLGGLLFGFDTGVISGALLYIKHDYALSAWMQGVVTTAVLIGAVGGAGFGGNLTDHFGRRPIIIVMAVLFTLGSLLSAAADGVAMLLIARLVLGIAVGTASMLTPLYLSELAPKEKRGATVSLNQLCLTIGILFSYLADYGFANVAGTWRWMLGVGAIPGTMLGLGMLFLPESPRWLASKGRFDQAVRVLRLVRGREDVESELSGLRSDVNTEQSDVSLGALFTAPRARLPLIVGVGLALFQQVTGINTVIYYAPSIFEQAGMTSPLLPTIGIGIVNVLATMVALLLLDRAGRRKLLLVGLAIMLFCLIALAVALSIGSQAAGAITAIALAVYVAGFAIGLGPIFWLLVAEIFPLAYRGLGMSVASMANWGSNLVVALFFPNLIVLLTLGGAFTLFALLTVAALLFVWKFVPETNGRSLEDIESDLDKRLDVGQTPRSGRSTIT